MPELFLDRGELYKSKARMLAQEFKIEDWKGVRLQYPGRMAWADYPGDPFHLALAAWIHMGRQSFFLSEGLTERLGHTDLRGAPTDALQFPYNAFWIEGAPDLAEQATHKDIPLGMLVVHEPAHAPCGRKNGCSCKRLLWIHYFYEHRLVTNRDEVKKGAEPHYTTSGWKTARILIALDKPTLEECVKSSLERMNETGMKGRAAANSEGSWYAGEVSDDATSRMVNFVANFALYLSTPDPDIQLIVPPNLGRHIKDETRILSQGKKHGTNWRAGQRFTRIYAPKRGEEREDFEDVGEGQKRRRHWVRGHWRQQPWGIGRSQKRLIWLMPFWRGTVEVEKPQEPKLGDVVKPFVAPPERIYIAAEGQKVTEPPVVDPKKVLASQHATYLATLRDECDQARKRGKCRICGERTGFGTSHDERETLGLCAKCRHEVSPKQQEYELWLLRGYGDR